MRLIHNYYKSPKGFTLIELLIVIAILGIISAIAIPMFLGQRKKAMWTEAHTNVQILYTLNEQYYAEYGRYAPCTESAAWAKFEGKYNGTGTKNNIENYANFRPGKPDDLNFSYYYKCGSVADGQSFTAIAVLKENGANNWNQTFTIDQNGEESTWTGAAAPW